MAYDSQTYGASPFGSNTKGKTAHTASDKTLPAHSRTTTIVSGGHSEALSDQLAHPESTHKAPADRNTADQNTADYNTTDQNTASSAQPNTQTDNGLPALPTHQAPALKSKNKGHALYSIPKGRTGLNILGEALGWLMAWGTVGFFRAYVPPPVLMIFDRLFNPWGMAGITLTAALLIGQLLTRYQLKIGRVRTLATTAIEYGEANHRADAQEKIFTVLTQAEEHSQTASRWIVSGLTALGCLFIIGAFY